MYKTKITIKNKEVTLKFGSWVMREMSNYVGGTPKFQKRFEENPFDIFPQIVLAAIRNASENYETDYTLRDIFDWMDEVGGFGSVVVQNIIEVFVSSMSNGVTVEKGEVKKKGAPARKN